MVFMIPALIVCVIIEALKLSQFNDDPTYMACYVNYYAQIGIIATFVIYLAPLIVTSHFLFFFLKKNKKKKKNNKERNEKIEYR